ncbi:MAG: hypothetical protein HRF50_05335 [Phycisphaerae bacterium]
MTPDDDERRRAELSAYLDGELDPRRAAEIELWLAESAPARSLLAELRAVSEGVRELPHAAAPPGFADAVVAAAAASPARSAQRALLLRSLRAATRVSTAAALIAIGVFVGWWTATPPVASLSAPPAVSLRSPLPQGKSEAIAPGATRDESVGRLRALGYVGAEPAEAPLSGDSPAADAELGERGRDTFVAGLPEPRSTSEDASDVKPEDSPGYVGGRVASQTTMLAFAEIALRTPSVTVTVEPRSRAEYDAAIAAVESARLAQGPTVALGRERQLADKVSGTPARAPTPRTEEAGPIPIVEARAAREYNSSTFQVPQSALPRLLATLEQQSPQRVQIAAYYRQSDATAVQGLFSQQPPLPAPPAAPPAVTPAPVANLERNEPARTGAVRGAETTEQDQATGAGARKTRPDAAPARGRLSDGARGAREDADEDAASSRAVASPLFRPTESISTRPDESTPQESLGFTLAFGAGAPPVFVQVIILPPRPDVSSSHPSSAPIQP